MFIIRTGAGTFYGPFDLADDACTWGREHCLGEWCCIYVMRPSGGGVRAA